MNYLPVRKTENNEGIAVVGQLLWPSIVFLGLLVSGALNSLRF